jgi:hypothetical protein
MSISVSATGPTPDEIAREFPVVGPTLRFRSEAERRWFFGGLSDGWGENACDISWGWDKNGPGGMSRARLEEQREVGITVFPDP